MAEHVAALKVHLQPGARKNEIVALRDDVLWVRVTAPAHKGRANTALLALMAESLGVPKTAVAIARGPLSRLKVIFVQGLSPQALEERLGRALPRT